MTKPRKPALRIPEAKWRRIRDDWLSSVDSTAALGARHGVMPSTIRTRSTARKWPPRGSLADDPATIARLLYADLTTELRDSLRSLRDPESPATATQRAPLIRAHRRALIALLDARKQGAANPSTPADGFPALDLEAARKDILARLERLDATLPDKLIDGA